MSATGTSGVGEVTGGRRVLICLAEARGLLERLCRGTKTVVELRTSDGRGAFAAALEEGDARQFLEDPRARPLVLSGDLR